MSSVASSSPALDVIRDRGDEETAEEAAKLMVGKWSWFRGREKEVIAAGIYYYLNRRETSQRKAAEKFGVSRGSVKNVSWKLDYEFGGD